MLVINNIKSWLQHQPQRIFLFDACGAFLTLLTLLCIIMPLEQVFGMPQQALLILSSVALLYTIYSVTCYLIRHQYARVCLKCLILANGLYGLVTLVMAIYHYELLTPLGAVYFLIELLILIGVIWLERYALTLFET
jgi:hypothetical protein